MDAEERRRKHREYMRAYYHSTPERKAKAKERAKRYRDANPERDREAKRRYQPTASARRKELDRLDPSRTYRAAFRGTGVTPLDYDTMLAAQNGGCWFCGTTAQPVRAARPLRRLVVDHDHATGRIRGLLCANCNLVLGRAEAGRPATIDRQRAEEYIGRPLPPPPTWSLNRERDEAIVRDRFAGLSSAEVGLKYGLKPSGIKSVLRNARERGIVDGPPPPKMPASGLRGSGVTFHCRNCTLAKPWVASVYRQRKRHHIGYFATPGQAAQAVADHRGQLSR